MLNKIVIGGVQSIVTCNICSLEGRVCDACPNLQWGNVNVVFPNQGQRKYDPYSTTYNEGWRDHPNLRYGRRPNPLALANHRTTPLLKIRNFLLEQMMKKMDKQKKETDLKLQKLRDDYEADATKSNCF